MIAVECVGDAKKQPREEFLPASLFNQLPAKTRIAKLASLIEVLEN